MKPYGIPRNDDVAHPDVGDIQTYGLASHVGRIPGKSGDYRPYSRSKNKSKVRRYWKRKARKEGKELCKEIPIAERKEDL